MKHEIDIFSEIVDSIRDRYDILTFSHTGTTYVFTTDNIGDMLVDDYIEILGIDCLVIAIDTGLLQFTVISESDLEAAQWWKAKKPYFDYEKILGEANILLEKTNSPIYRLQKYPLIFLALDIEQDRQIDQMSMSVLKNINVYILTNTENNIKYADWRLTNTFKTILIPLYELLIEGIKNHHNTFIKNDLLLHSYTERYFLGTADANQNVFNDYIDAIQITFPAISLCNLNPICDKTAVALPFEIITFSGFTNTKGEDVDYNQIITSEIIATNNSDENRSVTVLFLLNSSIGGIYTQIIAPYDNYTFQHIFEANHYVENTISVYSSFVLINTETLASSATPVFEMFYTSGTLSFRVGRYVESFITYLALEDGSTREININNYADTTYIAISQVYALATSKRISILDIFSVDYLYANSQTNLRINYNEIEKLKNIRYIFLQLLPNCYIAEHEIEKLTKLTSLIIGDLPNCYIAEHEIEKLINLTYIYVYNIVNCYIAEHEIEKLINLIYIVIGLIPNCYIAEYEIEKLTNLTYLYLQQLSNCYIAEYEIEKLINLTSVYLHLIPNCYIAEHEIEKLTKIPKTSRIFVLAIGRLKVANNEQFPSHYLYFNSNNMTSTDCDNVFISCHSQLLAGFVPVTKNINTAGATNAKVTAASLTARNYLAAQGYTLTYNS